MSTKGEGKAAMLINTQVYGRSVSECFDAFNHVARFLSGQDFAGASFEEKTSAMENLQALIMKSEIFATPALRMLQKFAADKSLQVRLHAAYAAGDAWHYESAAHDALDLLCLLREDECDNVREVVVRMAGLIGYHRDSVTPRAMALLDIMKSDGNSIVRRSASVAIGLIGRKNHEYAELAKDFLMEMKPDPDPNLNYEIDRRLHEIRTAEERGFEPPAP